MRLIGHSERSEESFLFFTAEDTETTEFFYHRHLELGSGSVLDPDFRQDDIDRPDDLAVQFFSTRRFGGAEMRLIGHSKRSEESKKDPSFHSG